MAPDEASSEDPKERVNRELSELLDEVRVAIPGVEVLVAFLLGVAFTERFDAATNLQRDVYFATLLLAVSATALLIAPTAYHRLNFRDLDKEQLLFSATRMAIASLGLLLLAMTGVVFLVANVVYGTTVSVCAGVLTAVWFLWFWFGLPLMKRNGRRTQRGGDGSTRP